MVSSSVKFIRQAVVQNFLTFFSELWPQLKNIFAMGDLGRQGWSSRGHLLTLRSLLCLLVRKNTMVQWFRKLALTAS